MVVPLRAVTDEHRPVSIPVPNPAADDRYERFITNSDDADDFIFDMPVVGELNVSISDRGRKAVFCLRGLYLSAEANGAVSVDRQAASAWEQFFPIQETDLLALRAVLENDWIVKSTLSLVKSDQIEFVSAFVLRIGTLDLPLRFNLPLPVEKSPFRYVVLKDGWRIDEIVLFKPVVYYTSFRSPVVHAQLYLSVSSLFEFGGYDGRVHILTDQPKDVILSAVPTLNPQNLSIQTLHPTDWVGYVASKYCILEWDEAYLFQPVLYMDPDTVFNADVTAMLIGIALADHLTAPIEDYSSLSTSPAVGSLLLQADLCDPRTARGMNAGTLGIPNLVHHGQMVGLIRSVIMNYLDAGGRERLTWVDQEVVNYLSYKIGHFETHMISNYVRYGGLNESTHPGRLNGLIHFWGCDRNLRSKLMEDYLRVRRAAVPVSGVGV